MLMMIIRLIRFWPDPYKIGMFFVVLLIITTTLGVILAFFFHQRIWCYVCPIGTMANWAGKGRYSLKIDSKLCTECGVCFKVCPMQIKPFIYKKTGIEVVQEGDCLKCGLCVASCPTKALNLG
jgi:polyferredoxin